MARDLSRNTLGADATLREVMARLDQGIGGIVLLVDGQGRLQGVLTDGDVRRGLLAGATMEDPAARHMNRSYASCPAGTPREKIVALLSHRVRQLPIVDEAGRAVDLVSWLDMWRMAIASPIFGGNELKYVSDCVAQGWISSQGEYVGRFEAAFADFIGGHSATTTSGTTALHLAMAALDIGPGDEVIVPSLTFGASANAVRHCGATPVFVDVDPATWTLDVQAAARAVTGRTRAIMPVHLYGHPCDMDPIMALARERGLRVVEDCAEALGTRYRGRLVGTIGDVGCFSFFANKLITTGEGGMVVTRDEPLMRRLRLLRDHGMEPGRRYWHVEAGFNYRMTNLQAAVGLAQMEQIQRFLERRAAIAGRYRERLAPVAAVGLPPHAPWAEPVCWLFSIVLDGARIKRELLQRLLSERGIETRALFYPLDMQPAYGGSGESACRVSARLSRDGLSLPTSVAMTLEDVDLVCANLATQVEQLLAGARLPARAAR